MHEVINLSVSQRSNHLVTHFYNSQLWYLESSTSVKQSQTEPNVFFDSTVGPNNTLNFTPRSLIWDMKGGFGALSQFEYFPAHDNEADKWINAISIEQKKVKKSEYQIALDQGLPLPRLNSKLTNYWTDYSHAIYNPKSYNMLKNWEFDPLEYPQGRLVSGQQKEFIGFDLGVEEWKQNSKETDFMDEKYRNMLEKCDMPNGLNLVTEIDSAWGGFTSEMLKELRDHYNPKSSVLSWGLHNDLEFNKLNFAARTSRIKTSLELIKNSSLFIPITSPSDFSQSMQIDRSSFWQIGALESVVFESLGVLNSRRQNPVNYGTIIDKLTLGDNKNIVSLTEAKIGKHSLNFSSKLFPRRKNYHLFSQMSVYRPPQESNAKVEPISSTRTLTNYQTSLPFPTPSSFPQDIVLPEDSVSTALSIDSTPRSALLEMKNFVSKHLKGDERENLISELATTADTYEYGYSDSDESDDDY